MDRITKSLLTEFCTDHQLIELKEETQFEHFAAYLTITRHHPEHFDTSDVVTGSGGDTGIDAVAVIVNGTLVTDSELVEELTETNGYLEATFVFVQAERSSSFEGAKIGQVGFGVADFFSETPKLVRNDAITEAAEVMAAVYALSSKFKRGNPTCRLYYVTTGKWVGDHNLEGRRKAVVDDLSASRLFRDVEFTPVDADGIQKLYNLSRNAIARDFTFAERTVVPEIPGVDEAYLGIIPANEFLTLIQDENGDILRSIFYDNVRDWQDYNPVNSGIRDTLASDSRGRFVLMNNGITVIAKTLRATGNRFHIEDYQVVNGCQTSHVLWNQREHIDDSVTVPLRLIATQNDEVIGAIIKATNRQTEVREEQLLALSDFQKKLELFFQSFETSKRLYYERRSRQYNNTQNVEKTRIITPSFLIRSYASMFLEEPHRTTRNYRGILASIGKDVFGSDHKLHPYYTAAFAHYRLEYLFRNQTLDAKYKPARYHLLLAARLLTRSDRPPRPNANEMEKYCDEILKRLWDTAASQSLFRDAALEVENVAKGNFNRDHIRTQPFTEAIKNRFKAKTGDTPQAKRK